MKFETSARLRSIIGSATFLLTSLLLAASHVEAALQPELTVSSGGTGIAAVLPLKHHNDLRLNCDCIDTGGLRLTTNTNDTLNGAVGQPPVLAQMTFNDRFRAQNVSLVFDHHLHSSPLYISAGVDIDNNHLDAISQVDQSQFQINNQTYSGATFGAVSVHVRWNSVVPYFGIGLQSQKEVEGISQRKPRLEAGILVQGPRHISVDTSGIVAANPAIFGTYVQAFTDRVPSNVPTLTIYPIVRLSVPL